MSTAAVKYINEKAGGIGGHRIEIVTCYIARTDEEGQKCGQQMANDKDIKAVVLGPVVFGVEPFYAAIGNEAGRSVGVSVNAVDLVEAERSHPVRRRAVHPGSVRHLRPRRTQGEDRGAHLTKRHPEPTFRPRAKPMGSRPPGSTIKVVPYATGTPDLSVPLQAAGATKADLVMPVINPPDCVKFQKAIQALGIAEEKVLASPVCLTPTTVEALGDFPKWIYAIAVVA